MYWLLKLMMHRNRWNLLQPRYGLTIGNFHFALVAYKGKIHIPQEVEMVMNKCTIPFDVNEKSNLISRMCINTQKQPF